MKHWSFLTATAIVVGSATCAMAEGADAFVRQVVIDSNRGNDSLEDRVLEAKLLAAYKRALIVNKKMNCQDTPSLGGYLNQQDGHELKSVKTISADTRSATVRIGFGPPNSSNDSIFYLQQVKGAWRVYDLQGVKKPVRKSDGFRYEYLNWKCETPR
jgi:hypothetical protein